MKTDLQNHNTRLNENKIELHSLIDDMYAIETDPNFRIKGLSENDTKRYLSLTVKLQQKINRL